MTLSDLQNNINYNNNLIADYNQQIQQLRKQIEQLDQLQIKLQALQTSFNESHVSRYRGIEKTAAQAPRLKLVTCYVKGMEKLINGAEYQKAHGGLKAAQQKVQQKKEELEEQTRFCINKIQSLQENNSFIHEQMRMCDN